MDNEHSSNSSSREKVLEHLFVGELLRCLWRRGQRNVDVLRAEVDKGGYDVVVECNRILRHIQLKTSHQAAATAQVSININLAHRPSGCVVWTIFNADTLELGPFLWFGAPAGEPLPDLGHRMGKHTKGDRTGHKAERTSIRIVSKGQFTKLATMDELADTLFIKPVADPAPDTERRPA